MSFIVKFDFGTGFEDITSYVKDFTINFTLMNSLKSNRDIGNIIIKNEDYIRNKILVSDNIEIEIFEDSNLIFKGFLRENYKWKFENIKKGYINVEFVDYGEGLEKKINETGVYYNYYICNTTNTSISIIHQLLYKAGYSDTDININDVLIQIDYFKFDKEEKFKDKLNELLFEFGYVFYFDKTGKFNLYKFLQNSFTEDITITEFREQINITKNKKPYDKIKLTWLEVEEVSNEIVASDTTGGTAEQKADIPLSIGEYYPTGSDSKDTYLNYNTERELLLAKNVSLDIIGDVLQEVFENYFTKAKIKLKANSNTTIKKLDIIGTAVYIKQKNIAIAGTGSKTYEFETKYIRDSGKAQDLSNYLLNYYSFSDYNYEFKCDTELAIGNIVLLNESFTGINTKVRIIGKKIKVNKGIKEITYKGVGVNDYTIQNITEEQEINSNPNPVIVDNIVENVPTYQEVIQDGFDSGGGTTTPDAPVWKYATVSYRTITLAWEKQWNLTNWERYEIQVSEDGTNWTDFEGVGGGTTPVYQEIITYIGDFTSDTPPIGKTYYFRIRQKTKTGSYSDWSSVISKPTNPLGGNQDDIIFYDQYNYWDLSNNKWRVGGSAKYIYFDGSDIYFKSVDIELTTADLITYNTDKSKRFRHTGLGLYWESGTNYGTQDGKIELTTDGKLDIRGDGITKMGSNANNTQLWGNTREILIVRDEYIEENYQHGHTGDSYPVYYYVGSLPYSNSGNYHKLLVRMFGGAWDYTTTHVTEYLIATRTNKVIYRFVYGGMGGYYPKGDIVVYDNGSYYDFYFRTNNTYFSGDFEVWQTNMSGDQLAVNKVRVIETTPTGTEATSQFTKDYRSRIINPRAEGTLEIGGRISGYTSFGNSLLLLKSTSGTVYFYVKLPIMVSFRNGTTYYRGILYLKTGTNYDVVYDYAAGNNYEAKYTKAISPGYYQLRADSGHTVNMYAAGVFGATGSVTASDIVS